MTQPITEWELKFWSVSCQINSVHVCISVDMYMKYWFITANVDIYINLIKFHIVTFVSSFHLPSFFKNLTTVLCMSNHYPFQICVICKYDKHISIILSYSVTKRSNIINTYRGFGTQLEPAHLSRPARTSVLLSNILMHVPVTYKSTQLFQIPSVFSRKI